MPTRLEFGSHFGVGLRFGSQGQYRTGVAFQHISNAGIKEPNRGINLIQLNVGIDLGR